MGRRVTLIALATAMGVGLCCSPAYSDQGTILREIQAIEAEALRCQTAQEVVQLYTAFLSKASLAADVRAQAEAKRESWKALAASGKIRLGKKWVSPEDAEQARKLAADLVKQGVDLVRSSQDKPAHEKLVEASTANPNGIQADFIMATVFAIVARNYDKANQHYEICLKRSPDNAAVLNNLALTELKLGQLREALTHWKKAVSLSPDWQIAHNLGRLIDKASKQRIALTKSQSDQANDLYARCTAGDHKRGGWQYMLIAAEVSATPTVTDHSSFVPAGTGFVIFDNYILTNRHVIEGSSDFEIVAPNLPKGQGAAATCVATCADADVAILKCDPIDCPAAPIDATMPSPGTDVMLLSAGPSAMQCSISFLPTDSLHGMCLYNTAIDAVSSGGPVCNSKGGVVAIHCMRYNTVKRYGAGIPMKTVLGFITETIPRFQTPPQSESELQWPDTIARIAKSCVLVRVKSPVLAQVNVRAPGPELQDVGLSTRVTGDYLEDKSCSLCNGFGNIKCPVRSCARGSVPSTERVAVATDPVTGATMYSDEVIRVRCPNCDGKGTVKCPDCNGNGIDLELR